ncbi:hypothetical protein [Lysobacter brunescens]|uniref:Uncharacterized protein n=1 Tax=Lysobacter brunescens TaxID=262323 RepID=A0ABW2YJ09_9GAMM
MLPIRTSAALLSLCALAYASITEAQNLRRTRQESTHQAPVATPPKRSDRILPTDGASRWDQVPGCARDITGAGIDIVYVTGCDVGNGERGASGLYRWNGNAFVPHASGGRGSAIASHGGNTYVVGGDALLWSSASDGAWKQRGTPDGRPIVDVGAGVAGLWVITSEPAGDGGNAIARATPCPPAQGQLSGNDFCGWERVSGAATRIAVGASVWVVTANNELYERAEGGGGTWSKRPGCFVDVAANGHTVYAIACRRGKGDGNAVLHWNNAGSWRDTDAAGKRVGVDSAGNAWVLTDSGQIWRRSPRVPAPM